MKMSDLDRSINLTEAPMGYFSKAGNKLMSYIPGDTGATAQGKIDSGEKANKLRKQFPRFLGRYGLKMTDANKELLLKFLRQHGVSTMRISNEMKQVGIDDDTPLDKADIDKYILMAVRDPGFRNASAQQTTAGQPVPATAVANTTTSTQNQQSSTTVSRAPKPKVSAAAHQVIVAFNKLSPAEQQALLKTIQGISTP